jgi:hypothetical protein
MIGGEPTHKRRHRGPISTGVNSMRRKIFAVVAALMLSTATMTPDAMAVGRGAAGGGRGGSHGFGVVDGGHGFGYGRYRRYGRGYGLYWYPPYYENGYDYGPSDAYGDITSQLPPLVGLAAGPPRAPIICKETVTVPSQDGRTRQIKMIRC